MNVIPKIIKKHIDYAEINRLIFDTKTVGEIAAQRITYQNMRLEADGKLALITFTLFSIKFSSIFYILIGAMVGLFVYLLSLTKSKNNKGENK